MTDMNNSTSPKSSKEKESAENQFSDTEANLYVIDMHLEELQKTGHAVELPTLYAEALARVVAALLDIEHPADTMPRFLVVFDTREQTVEK